MNAGKPLRILHLEDSPLDAELIHERLIGAGVSMQLDWAVDEREFTECLRRGGYDLILSDYRLPNFDAPAALLLTKSLCPGVPFIAVTGAVGEEDAVELLKQGATDYVLKDRLAKLPQAMERALAEVGEHRARRRAEEAQQRLNRELQAISNCNQVLMHAEDEQTLLHDICHIVCNEAGYRMAWVGFAENDEARTLRPIAWAGAENGYLQQAEFTWANTELGCGPSGLAVRSGEIAGIEDFTTDPKAAPWRDAALQRGYRSSISLPLKDERAHTFGVLNIYSADPKTFTAEEQRLLGELAGDLAFGIGTLRARIERKRAEESLKNMAVKFRTVYESSSDAIMLFDDSGFFDCNKATLRIFACLSRDDFINKHPSRFSPPTQPDGEDSTRLSNERIATAFRQGYNQFEWTHRRLDGTEFPAEVRLTAMELDGKQVLQATVRDITERKAAEKEIEHLAYYDLLTQLPNRRLLMDRLQQAMADSGRSGHRGALLFIDLDNFKILNDTCGHDVGDQLLIEVASLLGICVRDGDTVSRLGGDEFVVMLKDLGENPQEAAAQVKGVGEKILSALNKSFTIAARVHHSTASIGVILFLGPENSVDELLKQADIAMYQAKSAGRNTLRFFDPDMQAALAARAELETSLRLAIQEQQFVLHFQPQVDNLRGIIGAEALVRWQHPERGMVSPAQFIPLAEETGLILPIGQWVLEDACARLKAWAGDPRSRELHLSVNVSARQFHQEDFVDQVRRALENSGAPANRLKLELTESVVLDNVKDTIEKMQVLRQFGVGFSMDDFGTGYSSLSYLTRLPLDQLKIDQSFVRNLPGNANDALVVQAILTLAQSLGLAVIAEGVETEAQRQFLDQHGCPIFQGYLFSKPVGMAAFEELLASHCAE
jgi:diguanylate cyclase (GGDEF)-like protein/PAS domain S-box-containing protein